MPSGEAPHLRLLIAGDGPLRAELERRAGALGDVRFLGFVADVGAFMNACDIVAFPTQPELSEGFGLAALEAMAAARPVIATAVGSLPEVVRRRRPGFWSIPPAPTRSRPLWSGSPRTTLCAPSWAAADARGPRAPSRSSGCSSGP